MVCETRINNETLNYAIKPKSVIVNKMGSIWGTSPFSAYAAHLAEVHNITYLAPVTPVMSTSNVAVVGVPNQTLQMTQSIQPAPMAPINQYLGQQPVYVPRPATPVLQY